MPDESTNNALSLVLYYLDDEYREKYPNALKNASRSAWIEAAKIVERNDLLYYFSSAVSDASKTFSQGFHEFAKREEKKQERFQKTLRFIDSVFSEEGLDYLLIKLYRRIPHNPRDVDVLIRKDQKNRVISAYRKRNARIRTFDDAEINCEVEGLLKIDLYSGFYYFSQDFLEEDFLWAGRRLAEIGGVNRPILGYEADLASLLIHSVLSHRYLNLLDFLYAKSLLFDNKLNLDRIEEEAKKHGWRFAYLKMISTLRNVYERLYIGNTTVAFPIVFSPDYILRLFQLDPKRKFAFVASTLVDRALMQYNKLQSSHQANVPSTLNTVALRAIRKVKYWVGDRKGIQVSDKESF